MTVFKTFLKILNKNKFIVIMYTAILLIFGAANMQTSENSMSYIPEKPDVIIVNNDNDQGITKDLIKYIKKNSNLINITGEDKINDALFYREANYIIYIPKNYSEDFMTGKNPQIKVKNAGDYEAALAEMIVSRYTKVAATYQKSIKNENELIKKTNETLSKEAKIKTVSKIDSTSLEKAAYYFNFESYSLLACLIYVICLILSTFNDDKIRKRTIISSTDYKKNNRILLLSNCLYALVVWLLYLVVSFILIGKIMFTAYGLIYAINSLLFTICASSIAFLVGNIVKNKNTINGIVNVIALGSSFLCGAFVPQTYLPKAVLNIAHILPTYYYIKTNNDLSSLEIINFETLKPLFTNMIVLIIFTLIFIILTNIITKSKRKIG